MARAYSMVFVFFDCLAPSFANVICERSQLIYKLKTNLYFQLPSTDHSPPTEIMRGLLSGLAAEAVALS